MKRILTLSTLALACATLASCNESASDNLPLDRTVMHGDLVADGGYVRMRVDLGKVGSSVVVVLQGGDTLHASDGTTSPRMDFSSDLLGSFYRAAFPESLSASYTLTLFHAADGQSVVSTFPTLPTPFTITSPVADATVVLSSSPVVTVEWNAVISAMQQTIGHDIECVWRVTPLPPSVSAGFVEKYIDGYRDLTVAERANRRAAVNVQSFVDLQRAELAVDYPASTISLVECDAGFIIHAANEAGVNAALAGGTLESRRAGGVGVTLYP